MSHAIDAATAAQTIGVRYRGGERYEIAVRGHTILTDQPVHAGGEDLAPTPTELFVASLAGCVAFYAGRYLTRHGITREGLGVDVSYKISDSRPARVTDIPVTVRVPEALSPSRRPVLQAVVEHRTVHNSLIMPHRIRVDLS